MSENKSIIVKGSFFNSLTDAVLLGVRSKQLDAKISYKLRRLLNRITKELKMFLEEKNKLIEQYAKKDDKGNYLTVPGQQGAIRLNNAAAFEAEFNKLLFSEIDLGIEKSGLKLDILPDVSTDEIDFLSHLFEIEE